jgi:hypothetical protein
MQRRLLFSKQQQAEGASGRVRSITSMAAAASISTTRTGTCSS